jgi:hypothetical protein
VRGLPEVGEQTVALRASAIHELPARTVAFDRSSVRVTLPGKSIHDRRKDSDSHLIAFESGRESEVVIQPTESAVRFVQVLDDGGSSIDFHVQAESGASVQAQSDGCLLVTNDRGQSVAYVAAPWALDAQGDSLRTRYVVTPKGHISQAVSTRGAETPVTTGAAVIPHHLAEAPYPVGASMELAEDQVDLTFFDPILESVAFSPAGCRVVADYPHHSSHVPGTINTAGRVVCARQTGPVTVTAQLWENRWWGWDGLERKEPTRVMLRRISS